MEKEKLFSTIAKSICELSECCDDPAESGAHAAAIERLIQTPHTAIDDIQASLNERPIRAITLLALLYGERHLAAKGEDGVQQYLARAARSENASRIVNARHDKPNGSRDKQAAIRAAWASGKYTSRDICAEQECASLGMSFAAARKALRNTPAPG